METLKTPERQFDRLIEGRSLTQGRVLGISHPTLRLFAHDRAGRLSLRVLLPATMELKTMRSTIGIEVDVETREDGDPELAFISRTPQMDTLFLSFVRYAIDSTHEAETEEGAVRELVTAYETFVEFMTREKSLGPEALKGLYSELLIMLRLIEDGVSPSAAVLAWKGPFGDNKDFVLPDARAFEVKSAPLNASNVWISSIEQLEPNGLDLALCIVPMEAASKDAPEARTLETLIELVRDHLVRTGGDPASLTPGLEQYGLKPGDREVLDAAFVSRPPVQYAVLEAFPRIAAAAVPSGVTGVSYKLAIDAIVAFQVARESAIGSEVE